MQLPFVYLDPGSMSIFIQMLFSAAVGVCLAFRSVREKIGRVIARIHKSK